MKSKININNKDYINNPYTSQTLEWLNSKRSEAIKTASEKWFRDYKFIAESAYWFEQIADAVTAKPPTDNVKSIIVKENIYGMVIDVEYEYYKTGDPRIGNIGLCITTMINNTD